MKRHGVLQVMLASLVVLAATQCSRTVALAAEKAEASAATKEVVTLDDCRIEKFTIHSKAMNKDVKTIVILPPKYEAQGDKEYPIVHTLHGKGAPYTTFADMSPLRKALKDKPMIVTCFDGDKSSWYLDATKVKDSQYTTFFFKEFIPHIDKHYRVDSTKRGLAGFSMGGFGAFHYMLTKPEMFASVSGLSSAIWSHDPPPKRLESFLTPLVGSFAENEAEYQRCDVYRRIEHRLSKKVKLPPMYLHIGTEDWLLEPHRRFRDFLLKKKLRLEYRESPGKHNWSFWKGASAGMIDFHWRTFLKNYEPATGQATEEAASGPNR